MKFFRRKYRTDFSGDYSTWNAAKKACSGYEDQLILKKVRDALLTVKKGDAVYERDSVLFYEYNCSWPVLSLLLKIAIEEKNKLSVLDFGGSLGSSYFQFKPMIPSEVTLNWNIVEQRHFIEEGRRYFENDELSFFSNISEVVESQKVDLLFLSSVLPYLESPIKFLNDVIDLKIKYLAIDRTPFFKNHMQLMKQVVPEEIYKASYPAWFFNKEEIFNLLSQKYRIISIFDALDGVYKFKFGKAKSLGVLCQIKS